MDINTFIATYDGQVPAEEITLLRAAAAYYKYYYDNFVPPGDKGLGSFWNEEANIAVNLGTSGHSSISGENISKPYA